MAARLSKRLGNAKYFQGITGNYIDTGFTKNYAQTDSFTVEAWFKTPGRKGANKSIIGAIYEAGANDPGIRLDVNTSGLVDAFVRDLNGQVPSNVISTTAVDDNKWHHAALVRNVSLDKVQLYIDGVLEANINDNTTGNINIASSMFLGCYNNRGTAATYFLGSIDEVRISSIARYTAAFTAIDRNSPFVNDAYTDLLLHLEETDTPIDSSTTPNTCVVTGVVGNSTGYMVNSALSRTAI